MSRKEQPKILEEATATVTNAHKLPDGTLDETVHDESLGVHVFRTEPAVVRVSFGLTINMGNYESSRIDVGLSIPCYKEEIEDTFEKARKWVEERVQEEVQDVKTVVKKTVF